MVSEMGIILLGTPEDVDIVYSAWRHAAVHKRTGNDLRPLSNIRNLQNIPSNSTHAKLIKSCVQAPEGWLYVGLDFNALEDHISALTTKDENKLKVYLENYDAHALRACAYFAENMPDIIEKRKEIAKQGQTYKVVYSDGSVDYFNESNPILLTALQELKDK